MLSTFKTSINRLGAINIPTIFDAYKAPKVKIKLSMTGGEYNSRQPHF